MRVIHRVATQTVPRSGGSDRVARGSDRVTTPSDRVAPGWCQAVTGGSDRVAHYKEEQQLVIRETSETHQASASQLRACDLVDNSSLLSRQVTA